MLTDAVANAQAHGVIFVAAAGNDSSDNDTTPVYPANFEQTLNNVVSVAATDQNDALASFSNYGAKTVNVCAPGVDIYSTLPGGQYGFMSGTSMATPEVTGVLALVWMPHPNWTYSQVIARVLSTTDKVPGLQGVASTGGVVDAFAAVGAATAQATPPIVINASASGPAANSLSTIQVTFDQAINPATFTSSDITLYAPGGKTVAVAAVKATAGSGNRTFSITFATQTAPGVLQSVHWFQRQGHGRRAHHRLPDNLQDCRPGGENDAAFPADPGDQRHGKPIDGVQPVDDPGHV